MTAVANNIIQFPPRENFRNIPPQNIEEVNDQIDTLKHIHVQESIEMVIPILFNNLAILGFDPDENDHFLIKDGSLVVESVRSFLNKFYGINHPLQIISENLFETIDEEGNLEMTSKFSIVLKSKEELT